MQWLFPSVVATLAGTLIQTLTYCYLYYRERHKSLALWSIAWSIYVLRFVFLLLDLQSPSPVFLILNQTSSLLNGFFLLWGIYAWTEKRFSPYWFLILLAGPAWIVCTILTQQPFLLMSIPTFTLIGITNIFTGIVFMRNRNVDELGQWFVGIVFILWGIHKLDYPFLRPIEWLAPWGYLLGAFFSFFIALGFLVIYLDRNRRELFESRELLRSIYIGADTVSLIIADLQGIHARILTFSPGAEKMFGYRAKDVIGHEVAILHTPEDVLKFPKMQRDIREKKIGFTGEVTLVRKNGEPFPALFALRPICDQKGNVISAMGIASDITELKNSRRDRENLINELSLKNTQLEQFVYTVSHDLKSPLITISGFLGMLKADLQKGKNDQVQEDITTIQSAVDRMNALLASLLELSRSGRELGEMTEVDMNEVGAEVLEILNGAVRKNAVRVDLAPDLPPVKGDHQRIVQVLQNLVDNAIKYMGDQTHPRIQVGWKKEPDNQTIRFFVKDNGMGIDPVCQDRIFNLFEKLSPNGSGTGIGLAVVKRIVELHGGSVWVESNDPDEGSTFFFTLPCYLAESPVMAATE